jgi:hypothetical protein
VLAYPIRCAPRTMLATPTWQSNGSPYPASVRILLALANNPPASMVSSPGSENFSCHRIPIKLIPSVWLWMDCGRLKVRTSSSISHKLDLCCDSPFLTFVSLDALWKNCSGCFGQSWLSHLQARYLGAFLVRLLAVEWHST